ncbi:MAG TPA: discoidin domain-containing protein [Polyangiaceae bacterium]|nr:discoidin domain-containing protein [Polyangiaceae bacterium]
MPRLHVAMPERYPFPIWGPFLADWQTMPPGRATPRQGIALAGGAFLSLAGTASLAQFGARQASAGSLAVAHERTAVLDALHAPSLLSVRAADPSGDDARFAADGREETAWAGRAGELQWTWSAVFAQPVHVGLLRVRFGSSPTSGIPTAFRWETRRAPGDGKTCAAPSVAGDGASSARRGEAPNEGWVALDAADQTTAEAGELLAQPTRRSWFVDADTCGLRLVIDRTNAGPPVIREVQAIESARDVLRAGEASDDGAYPGFRAANAIDGTYAARWAGAPGKSRWVLRVDLREPQPIDRIRLVLGFDATSVPRAGAGRPYAIAWGPVHYVLEVSEDGRRFAPIAADPLRADGSGLPLRRRLVTLPEPRTVRALRLVMTGATGETGVPEAGAVPVVREIAAYRADDKRPILAAPWILSVNANPSAESHGTPGGEVCNDAYHAKFLQARFTQLLPALRRDDRYARSLGDHGEPLDAPASDEAGEVLESIEGDDPLLDAQFLSQESPPPLGVLSGSNDWDYAAETAPDAAHPKRWHWDPLRDARFGGMGQLGPAVRTRVAPFIGFCGGAQILALLAATHAGFSSPDEDLRMIDRVLRRTSGRPIRGFARPVDVERAWPADPHPARAKIQFLASDPLFEDLAGALRRSTTQALPELHSDAIRPDTFLAGGLLDRFEVLATSAFCAADVIAASPRDGVFPNPNGPGWCDTVPEAFRSKDRTWPIIGSQFHAEQKDFAAPGPGDPPESVADARLFLASAFEQMVDAYVKLAP